MFPNNRVNFPSSRASRGKIVEQKPSRGKRKGGGGGGGKKSKSGTSLRALCVEPAVRNDGSFDPTPAVVTGLPRAPRNCS